MTEDEFRALALELTDASERDHHGRPSFRVPGGIVATVPSAGEVNIMAGESAIRGAISEFPVWCREQLWGQRLAAVRVTLAAADATVVAELLDEAVRERSVRR